jgi:hypothetical protein
MPPLAPRPQTHIRPTGHRSKPLAPRSPNEKFGHTVNPKTNDHWEPTIEIRWYRPLGADTLPPILQQRWKCVQHSQSRVRPVELYYEWRTVTTFVEQPKVGAPPTADEGINKLVV